ncbi:TauD/TfdA family dioxygenase [Pararoseomonas indoligenes]|uniref:TauD/TfdA family dioxygenase n=1 Tax=Roseomonas indoligenes TaxID=2820811 RepID=A0A940S8B4_9PROT|nr:TauD/TfdA family dioxygenase [Pararoseomonas indoligenes]MBP0495745.1 TauD/TfdA family dioxygenase [Pararoseomonas indoligenes]
MAVGTPIEWTAGSLSEDQRWTFTLDDRARRELTETVLRSYDPEKALIDYSRADFDLGSASEVIAAAFTEAKHGRGIALVHGLPRDTLDEKQFELLTWAIGLHSGVPRPQGKSSHYISAVRDAGTVYRSAGGRGYSSNAELDFHTDGADVVGLTCFNQAKAGGNSMVTSSITAHNRMAVERPDLAEALHEPFYFSRQAEQAADEGPFYPNPVFDECEGLPFSKWNRNRVTTAQRLEGVPSLTPVQREATDMLDAVLRRPELMYNMTLRPGDMQLLNNHVTLHSRTDFEDHEDPARKRLLFRLWMAPPDSVRLPESWRPAYRSVEPGTVRGGIIGQSYDAARQNFDRRQAGDVGMRFTV